MLSSNFFISKVVTVDSLNQIRKKYPNRKIILISGCFDILHKGHIEVMESAKKTADILIIGVLSDKFVKKRKGDNRPIFNEKERINIIASLQIVNYAFIMDISDTDTVLQKLSPDFYGVGGDRKIDELPEKRWLNKYKIKIKYLPRFGQESTTMILKRILR